MVTTLLTAEEYAEAAALVTEAQRRGINVAPEIEHAIYKYEATRRGLLTHDSFREFLEATNPTMLQFEHIPLLADELDRVARGETRRLLVMMPPRYLKSEAGSRQFPAYYLRKFPERKVGLASYGSDLAWELSEAARTNYELTHGRLKDDTKAKKRWATERGGEMWASGVGGPLLGRGFHLGIVDDPVDPEQAHSPTYHRRFRLWWPEKFLSRQEPDAAIVVIMQRLGVDDPIDYILRREVGEKAPLAPEHWRVLVMDEIKSDEPLGRWNGPMGLPPTCTLVEDKRAVGELLAPSRFNREQVLEMQRSAGPLVASAQRQQRPMRPQGDFWHKDWFRVYDTLPGDAYNGGKDWDTAYTEQESNAASGYVESYRGPGAEGQFPIYIHDVDWRWVKFPELTEWMRSLPGPHYVEQKASGKSAVQALQPHGINAEEVGVKGSKLARASAAQPAVSNRRVFVRREILERLLMGERQGLLRISAEQLQTESGHLDVNDMFVQALHRHLGIGAAEKKQARVFG